MTPLFIYRRNQLGSVHMYLVREPGGQRERGLDDYELVASIDARSWLQSFLNCDKEERERMIRELGT